MCGRDIYQVPNSCHTHLRNEKEMGPSGQACALPLESRVVCFMMRHNLIPAFHARHRQLSDKNEHALVSGVGDTGLPSCYHRSSRNPLRRVWEGHGEAGELVQWARELIIQSMKTWAQISSIHVKRRVLQSMPVISVQQSAASQPSSRSNQRPCLKRV